MLERRRPTQTKFSFGATSAIITNLGLIVGLRTGEHAKLGIIAGMLVIALADNISDSFGIHIYQESECLNARENWASTFTNFFTRILVSLTFILLVFFLPMQVAAVVSVIWGLFLLATMSCTIACREKANPFSVTLGHLTVAVIVIIASDFAGRLLISRFKF